MPNSKLQPSSGRPDKEQERHSLSPTSTSSNFHQAALRWTGFTQPSNLIFFCLTTGVFAIFSALQTRTLEEGSPIKPNPPGGPFWFKEGSLQVVMQIHLWSVIPAGVLLPLQFLPAMRYRYMYLHKVSGRVLLVLLPIGNVSALTMAKHSFGGTITTQVLVITVAFLTTFSMYKSWSSILSLRIDQHRAWILRTWSYACMILSLRIFMFIIANAIAKLSPNSFKSIMPCNEIIYMYQFVTKPDFISTLYSRYPACTNLEGNGNDVHVIVNATLSRRLPEEKAALMNMVFGVSGWVALVIHILLVEVYLNYSKDEDERLKKVSLIRRKAAGYEVKGE